MRTEELVCVAEKGDATAALALGFFWERSGSLGEAERYYRIAARSSPIGAAALASVLAVGVGQRFSSGVRREEAIRLAEFAAKENVATGHVILGMLSMSTDPNSAVEHFHAAHRLGSDMALSYIGQIKADVGSSQFDIDEAERILIQILENNRIVPHCLVATICFVKGKKVEAISALRQGVKDGDAEAMYTLAMCYRLGTLGVDRDEGLAAELQAKADAAFHL